MSAMNTMQSAHDLNTEAEASLTTKQPILFSLYRLYRGEDDGDGYPTMVAFRPPQQPDKAADPHREFIWGCSFTGNTNEPSQDETWAAHASHELESARFNEKEAARMVRENLLSTAMQGHSPDSTGNTERILEREFPEMWKAIVSTVSDILTDQGETKIAWTARVPQSRSELCVQLVWYPVLDLWNHERAADPFRQIVYSSPETVLVQRQVMVPVIVTYWSDDVQQGGEQITDGSFASEPVDSQQVEDITGQPV